MVSTRGRKLIGDPMAMVLEGFRIQRKVPVHLEVAYHLLGAAAAGKRRSSRRMKAEIRMACTQAHHRHVHRHAILVGQLSRNRKGTCPHPDCEGRAAMIVKSRCPHEAMHKKG